MTVVHIVVFCAAVLVSLALTVWFYRLGKKEVPEPEQPKKQSEPSIEQVLAWKIPVTKQAAKWGVAIIGGRMVWIADGTVTGKRPKRSVLHSAINNRIPIMNLA